MAGVHIQNTKVRTAQRVRVTSRIMSEKDHRGRRVLLAREGEVLSIREALRREIPEEHLEPVGVGGRSMFDAYRQAAGASSDEDREAAIATAETAAAEAERHARQDADAVRADRMRGGTGDLEYPRHRGGTNWELSDGTIVQADDADAAAEAEAGLSSGPADGTVDEILGAVGDDVEKAEAALDAEQAKKKPRKTLVEALEAVVAAGQKGA